MTTAGYEAEPHDVEALLNNLCGDILAEKDPLVRYVMLTKEQVLYDALVSAIKRERGKALAEMAAEPGTTKQKVADAVGLGTRQRVDQLIAAAGQHAS